MNTPAAFPDPITAATGRLYVSTSGSRRKTARLLGLTPAGRVRLDFGHERARAIAWECSRDHFHKHYRPL